MTLENRVALVHGATDAVGSVVVCTLAAERAQMLPRIAEGASSGAGAIEQRVSLDCRPPTVAEVARVVALIASDRAARISGPVVNTCCPVLH